jgi:HK97 gp10 family phage protein
MSDDVSCTLDGLDDLEELLQIVAPDQAKKAVRASARKAGQIWQDAIEAKAPVDKGFLKDHIKVSTVLGQGDDDSTGSVTVVVGPTKDAFYALFSEFGTRNEPAKPFVQPAYEEKKDEVLSEFATQLLKALTKLGKPS